MLNISRFTKIFKMKKLTIAIFVATLFFSTSALAQTSETSTKQEQKKTAFDGVIKFDSTTVDFGKTKLNHPVTVSFTFTNISKKPVIIKSAQPSCGCTTPSWTKEPVLPGKKGIVKATYNADAVGKTNKTVFVNFGGIPQTMYLQLTGKVTK